MATTGRRKGNTYLDLGNGTTKIILTQGQTALISTSRATECKGFTWHAHWDKSNSSFRVTTTIKPSPKKWITQSLSSFLMGREALVGTSDGLKVDHINNDSLDNRDENLQVVSNRINCSKDKKDKNGNKRLTGASFHKASGKWRATIQFDKSREVVHLGLFDCEIEAHEAYLYAREVVLALEPLF